MARVLVNELKSALRNRAVDVLLGRHDVGVDVIGGLHEARGAALVAEFQDLPGALRFFPADLSSLEEINSILGEYLSQTHMLDAAFLNAGIFHKEATVDGKGRDTAFIVNYSHQFVFARRLNSSAAPEILINGSANIALGLDLDPQVYGRRNRGTKGLTHALAANGFLPYWLNRKFPTSVPVQLIDPGYVNTKMVAGGGLVMRLLSRWFAITSQKAVEKVVQCHWTRPLWNRTAGSLGEPKR